MSATSPTTTYDEFHFESIELTRARVRIGSVAIALLKPLFLPLFYLNAPQQFSTIISLYAGIVLLCACSYYLTYKIKNPYTVAIFMLVTTYGLVIISLFMTGMSKSVFFPLILMCIASIGLIASWRTKDSIITFGLILGFYVGGILLFDNDIDWKLFSINLTALADATLVGTFGIWMLEQLRAKEFLKRLIVYRERETISRMLHDSLGADLHTINLLCELSRQNQNADPESEKSLSRISEIARKGIDDIREFLSLEENDSIKLTALLDRMRDYGNALFIDRGVNFMFNDIAAGNARTLSPLHACNLYLLYKEALANVSKHAKADAVSVSMTLDKGVLHLAVTDNGQGFDMHAASTRGRGLKNIAARAEEMNGRLDIRSQQGKGTEVRLSAPLHA